MLTLSPILNFQNQHKEAAAELSKVIKSGFMATSMSFALAELASRPSITQEQIAGAKLYIEKLMNLAEPLPAPVPAIPSKELGQKTETK